MATFRRDAVDRIEIDNAGERILLPLKEGRWTITEPIEDFADADLIGDILDRLGDLHPMRKTSIQPADTSQQTLDLTEYGLEPSRQKVILKGRDMAEVAIHFGVHTTNQSSVYAMLKGSGELSLVDRAVKELLFNEPDTFRDPYVTRILPSDFSEIHIKQTDREIKLNLAGGDWFFESPLQARADSQKVYDQLALITSLKILNFLSGDLAASASADLAAPKGTISLTGLINGQKQELVIHLGNEVKGVPDALYASISGRHDFCAVPKAAAAILNAAPNELRSRKLAKIQPEELKKVVIENSPAQPQSDPRIELVKIGKGWYLGGDKKAPAQQSEVYRFLQRLDENEVLEFVSDAATDFSPYGLEAPRTTASFFREDPASRRAKGSGTELQLALKIAFGNTQKDQIYVRTNDSPFVFLVKNSLHSDIFKTMYQWRTLLIQARNPEEIRSIHISHTGKAPLDISRAEADRKWKSDDPARPISPDYAESLARSIAALRALRWADPKISRQECGLDQAEFSLSFLLADEDVPRTISIGKEALDGRYASFSLEPAIFILSKPTCEVLNIPIELQGKTSSAEQESQ